jgi:hypothetical protein
MIFIDNKYTHWYNSIVKSALARNFTDNTYIEKHHIIPKSLGGSDNSDNLVNLTAREHFVCHRLLTKMTEGIHKRKMFYAQNMMLVKTTKQDRTFKISNRTYQKIKEEFALVNPFNNSEWQRQNRIRSQGRKFSEKHIQNILNSWNNDDRRNAASARSKQQAKERKDAGIVSAVKGRKFPERTGSNNSFYGKRHSDDFCQRQRDLRKGKPTAFTGLTKTCMYCSKTMDLGNFARYHGPNCKLKN